MERGTPRLIGQGQPQEDVKRVVAIALLLAAAIAGARTGRPPAPIPEPTPPAMPPPAILIELPAEPSVPFRPVPLDPPVLFRPLPRPPPATPNPAEPRLPPQPTTIRAAYVPARPSYPWMGTGGWYATMREPMVPWAPKVRMTPQPHPPAVRAQKQPATQET